MTVSAALLWLCVFAGVALLAVVGAILIFCLNALPFAQRLGLGAVAAGIVGAGIPRLIGIPPGIWDLSLLVGLLVYFGATYGAAILKGLDGMDGAIDGRLNLAERRHDA